jgi:excisionase family DNA binding protein
LVAERLADLARRRYLSVAHAAEYADLSEDSIRSLLSSGKLTALRPVPGRVVIDRRELDALLLSSTRRPRRARGVYDRSGRDGQETREGDGGGTVA